MELLIVFFVSIIGYILIGIEIEIGLDVEPSQGLVQPKWENEKWVDNRWNY